MDSETTITSQSIKSQTSKKHIKRLKTVGVVLTILGVGLFSYFIYSVGIGVVIEGIGKIGFGGFAVILFLYLLKFSVRATAWRLTIQEPHKLEFKDTLPAVIIGEALSTIIPLGILVSGTAKAVAVRKKVPIVVGLSSVATENLFYTLVTALFICFGSIAFLRQFQVDPTYVYLIDFIIGFIIFCLIVGILIIVRQWYWVSNLCSWLYNRNFFTGILEKGRGQVHLFESLIFSFYRKYPKRFFPLCLLQVLFHSLGIIEVWFIINRISDSAPPVLTAFFLETMSRLVTIVFKLVPFLVGVDEAGAEFIINSLGIAAGIGVTLAIIRKGRTIFWSGIGMILIIKRGLSFNEIKEVGNIE